MYVLHTHCQSEVQPVIEVCADVEVIVSNIAFFYLLDIESVGIIVILKVLLDVPVVINNAV